MSDPSTYDIRPAALRGPASYVITQEGISSTEDTPWTLPYENLQMVTFIQHRIGDQLFWRLDLQDEETLGRIATSFPFSDRENNEDCTAFIDLTNDFCTALNAARPDLQVGYGEHGKSRLVLFGIGIASTLFGLGILIAAILSGVSGERLIGGGIAIALLVVLGVVLTRAYNPWRKPILMETWRLPRVLGYLAGRPSTGTDAQ